MASAARLLAARPLLWAVLAIPALPILAAAAVPGADLEALLNPTGEWSARLLIVALMLTPLALLLPNSRAVRWLVSRRRAFGLAAFAYAALHTAFYVVAMGHLDDMLAELGATGIWTGWAALLVMLPLAATSNDAAMRALRSGWKRLQRLAYAAAVLTLVHWISIHDGLGGALAHFAPLALLQLIRLVRPFVRSNP